HRLVRTQPYPEIGTVKYLLRVLEVGDCTQDREEVRLRFRPDLWELSLVVTLKQVRRDVTSRYLRVVEGKRRIIHSAPDHLVRMREVVLVMTVCAAKRSHGRHRVPSPARPTSALLVVCSGRRHVAE